MESLPTVLSPSRCRYNSTDLRIDLGLEYPNNLLFNVSSINLQHGFVYGICAANGTGKSSFVEVLAARAIPNFPLDLSVATVRSGGFKNKSGSLSVKDYLFETFGLRKLELEESISVQRVYLKVWIRRMMEIKVKGWKMKCYLAKAILTRPEILILDEPSFLDAKSTSWMIDQVNLLARKKSIILLISHKEELLDSLSQRFLYITPDKTMEQFNGTYESFQMNVERRNQTALKAKQSLEEKQKAQAEALKVVHTSIAKSEKTVANIGDKRFIKGRSDTKKMKATKSLMSRDKRLKKEKEHVESIQVKAIDMVRLDIEGEIRDNADIPLISVSNVRFIYDESSRSLPIFDNLDFSIGTKARIVYFPQSAAEAIQKKYGQLNAIEYLNECLKVEKTSDNCGSLTKSDLELRLYLSHFSLSAKLPFRKLFELSTGQRTRLYLAKELLLHPNPNLLILDEISDNLDRQTVDLFVDSLKEFPAAILAISHQKESFLFKFSQENWSI
eukprot:Awhi_evm1s5624